MNQVTVSIGQLAQYALSVMDKAQVPADDQTLAMVQATRQFLHGITQGKYTVTEAAVPVQESDAPLPPHITRAQRRARGMEGVQPATKPTKGGIPGGDGVVSDKITGAPGR